MLSFPSISLTERAHARLRLISIDSRWLVRGCPSGRPSVRVPTGRHGFSASASSPKASRLNGASGPCRSAS